MADTTTDFGDDGFHEIQLSGKQLVFLFMATTVLSVIIFLTGVMVGRNARVDRAIGGGETAASAPSSATGTAAATPASVIPTDQPTPATGDDLTYRKRLEAEGRPVEQLAKPGGNTSTPPRAEEAPEPAAEDVATSGKSSAPPSPGSAAANAASDASKTPAPAATATTGRPGRYVVQLVVLRDRNAASSIVRRLASKGYPAFVTLDSSSSSQLYKVQVGRFDNKREAQQVALKLEKEEKFKPWIFSSLALLSGLLLALSFPKFGHPAFAWLALTPLIVAVSRAAVTDRPLRRAFFLGLATGAVAFAGTLYWLVETMTTFGGLATPVALLAAALLVAYLALFPAAFATGLACVTRAIGPAGVLMAAPLWVASELGRQYVWDGFPWALLGYSQVTLLPIAQLASVTGVYGLSGLLALAASAAALIVIDRGTRRWGVAAATVVLVAVVAGWGARRLTSSPLTAEGEPIRVAVLQGNIEQEEKWDPALRDAITNRYLEMTRQALAAGARFILWPESSTPFYFQDDLTRGGVIRRLAHESGATLLVGSDQIEPVKPASGNQPAEARYYNAAFLVKDTGETGAIYRKMHLVPFGEYVPLKRLLFFVGPIVEAVSDFTPGDVPVLLPVGTHTASTAICYEVIYGSLIREFVLEGSELLTTITNDAWYGRSSAAYQHWDQAAMRAIENGRYLARAANTGISGFVDPYGRVIEKSDLFEQRMLVHDLRFLTGRTVYSRIGDLIAWLCLALSAAGVLAALRVGRLRRLRR